MFNFLKSFSTCSHSNVPLSSKGAYCPDCGKYVVVKWYITRCSCCDMKRQARTNFSEDIVPVAKYCPNCGSPQYYIEECEKINIVDINFAVHKKEEFEINSQNEKIQIWESKEEPKILMLTNKILSKK